MVRTMLCVHHQRCRRKKSPRKASGLRSQDGTSHTWMPAFAALYRVTAPATSSAGARQSASSRNAQRRSEGVAPPSSSASAGGVSCWASAVT
jgi:hypothetical protein